ncbi:hypothetical protein BGZ94_007652 [Podila epigama]|nr:hypothetical protein BGZ94_007652 [Podila epigama]
MDTIQYNRMARFLSILLLLVALLCSTLVQAITVYVKDYKYSNKYGGVTQERLRMSVQIGSYHGEVDGHTIYSRSKYCSKDGVFCIETFGADCRNYHMFKFYYGNRSVKINMYEEPDCNEWPVDSECKLCNKGELTFDKKGFTFDI